MADIAPTGSTVTIPTTNIVTPGIDLFNDLVSKVNASLNAFSTGLGTAANASTVADLSKAVGELNTKTQSDLQLAIKDLTAKYYVAQTSSQPTQAAPASTMPKWLIPVLGFLGLWLYLEKKKPL